MKERDYIIASGLATVRAAKVLVNDTNYPENLPGAKEGLLAAQEALCSLEHKLQQALDESNAADEVRERSKGVGTVLPWEIWEEGFRITGESGTARFLGIVLAPTFADACAELYKHRAKGSPGAAFDPNNPKVWGCSWYDNEADARKAFG